ncbi:MAG: S8 family serine peptidase, partial [Candidatus Poseidoniaceae archaeon]|nr:S8 family serine peptidase [Candidatus Poseidoniaceae archaeon]
MWNRNRVRASTFIALLLVQIITPLAMINVSASPQTNITTNVDLDLLSEIGIHPSGDVENGWIEPSKALSQINLLYRNANVIPLDSWGEWTESSNYIQGWYVITHTFPIPTEWKSELQESGIDCYSYLPPNGFHCEIKGHTVEQLDDLNVEGIFQLDSVDKVREDLVRGLLGQETNNYNPYAVEDFARVNLMLSGEELPEGTYSHRSIKVNSHDGRFATLTVNSDSFRWLVMQGEIEWVETSPYFLPSNTVGAGIIHADDVKDSTKMNNAVAGWNGLDGSGIIVTVADSGIDNGVNNSGMHPDFADHITGILSWPDPNCAWSSPGVPGPSCDDGAEDDNQMAQGNGHGTHVAGSVLGDGTHSNGAIVGVAPEANLLFHAWEQNGCFGCGIPNNLVDMLDLASENGSRIHTNSWGAPYAGVYTTSSAQIDEGTVKHDEIVVLFAAGNDGTDADSNGEVDLDSLGSPSTAKNSITIGASENYRPIYGGSADNISGMAGFSSRGPTDDGRTKPDFVAPGTFILSTFSRSAGTGACWDVVNSSYCYMGGTSMATPIAAGATALLLQHLIENRGVANPSSALVKAIYGANSHDMMGQFSSPTNGAGEAVPNPHEGLGLLNMWSSKDASFVDYESLSTSDDRGWSFNVPAAAQDLQLALAYNDPKSTPGAGTHLVNDLDLSVKDPSGTWTHLSDDLNNLRMLNFSSPTAGTWEVHVVGTSVPDGPQFFSLALNADYSLTNLTLDADFDGVEDDDDDCPLTFGNSTNDRVGCIDTDGDGYSNPDGVWTTANGADALISVKTQWVDQDGDGYGDNPAPAFQPDGCTITAGTSTTDRFGCPDADSDGYSDPDGGWTIASGADSCPTVVGISSVDRNGCPDEDSDGVSDPDPSGTNGSVWTVANGADAYLGDSSQWIDTDGDTYGDNPPPATTGDSCPAVSGTSTLDRYGCTDTDGDGWSDPDGSWTVANGADAFMNEPTQWVDTDGDGYGDNSGGVNPDHCPSVSGTSSQMGHLGCPDTDGDGYWDSDDEFPSDGTQWVDDDDDGYGENIAGNNPDMCPTVQGFSNQDRMGCPDTDGDGYSDEDLSGTNGPVWTTVDGADVWPSDTTQWADSDGDGYGDNSAGTNGDACPSTSGTSTADRNGCLDSDGDGYSDADIGWTIEDGADAFPSDASKWSDFDLDGLSDQGGEDACPNHAGSSIHDRMGCPDTDGDGYSDADSGWTFANGADVFNSDPTQWNDTDSDGYGDEETGNLADDCPNVWGDSWRNNTLGCLDTDQDGWADQEDAQPDESTQWSDIDGDGYGDNLAGVMPDACPSVAGNSTLGNRMGCLDDDGDGWDNDNDAIDDNPTQWLDQ